MASIQLNFLQLKNETFSFPIYRRLRIENEQKDAEDWFYSLPTHTGKKEKTGYFVSLVAKEGYDIFEASCFDSVGLTNRVLFAKLLEHLNSANELSYPFHQRHSFAEDSIDFIVEEFPQGKRLISLSSYFLKEKSAFGFLVDFHFKMNDGTKFDREIQRLSLSLDSNYSDEMSSRVVP